MSGTPANAMSVTPTAPRTNLAVRFDLASSPNDPREGLPPLKASDQRTYDKLSAQAKAVITSQQPAGFRETTRELALNMVAQCSMVRGAQRREEPFIVSDPLTPFYPESIRIKAKCTPSAALKDNTEAKAIAESFDDIIKECKNKLYSKMHEMKKLETKVRSK